MYLYLAGYISIALIVLYGVNRLFGNLMGKRDLKDEPVLIDPSFTGSVSGPVTEPLETPGLDKPFHGDEKELRDIRIGPILFVLILGMFMAILDQTIVNVAIPKMMNDFGVSANTIQWLVTGFMLVNGVLIPISAYLMETFGTRSLFIVAMGFFTAGSLVCGIAPNFAVMMVGRVIAAGGAGILMPLVMNVFLTVFPPERRGAAMGTVGLAMIFAPAIGPTLSGWVVQNYSWRLLFYGMVPFGLVDMFLAFNLIRNVLKRTYPKFDPWGVLFSTLGFGGLLYAFSEAGNKGWGINEVFVTLIAGIVFVIVFIWRELTVETPMLEFRVFKYDVFSLTTLVSCITNMAMYAVMVLLPIYLQNIRGFTPMQSGLLLLPGALIMGIMSPVSGALFDRIGARPLAITGLIITSITTYRFSFLSSDIPYTSILVLYIMRSFGMSLLMMTVMTAGLNQLPRQLNSHGTAMANTMRQVAGSLGTAFLVTVMTNRANFHLQNFNNLVSTVNPTLFQQFSAIGQGLGAMAGLPSAAVQPLATQVLYGLTMQQATINGIDDTFIVATGITLVALFFSFFIRRVPVEK